MTDQPELFRVQTTDGKSVVVFTHKNAKLLLDIMADRVWHKETGQAQSIDTANINLDTLEPLNLLTDEELQARDDAIIARYVTTLTAGDFKAFADAVDAEAMKGQAHER